MSKGNKADKANGESVSTLADATQAEVDAAIPQFVPPEGFKEMTSDVIGFWDGDAGVPLFFIPESATVHDSDLDPTKPSVLIRGRVLQATNVYLGDEILTAEEGELVGVWAKPGMKALRDLAGVEVWIRQTGEKDVGKPSPMKTFGVFAKQKGSVIPVEADYRDKSKGKRHILEGAPLSHSNPPSNHASTF